MRVLCTRPKYRYYSFNIPFFPFFFFFCCYCMSWSANKHPNRNECEKCWTFMDEQFKFNCNWFVLWWHSLQSIFAFALNRFRLVTHWRSRFSFHLSTMCTEMCVFTNHSLFSSFSIDLWRWILKYWNWSEYFISNAIRIDADNFKFFQLNKWILIIQLLWTHVMAESALIWIACYMLKNPKNNINLSPVWEGSAGIEKIINKKHLDSKWTCVVSAIRNSLLIHQKWGWSAVISTLCA